MPEQSEQELHDWVRQTLQQYQPEYSEQEWRHMQRKLRYHAWRRKLLWVLAVVVLIPVGVIGRYQLGESSKTLAEQIVPVAAGNDAKRDTLSKLHENAERLGVDSLSVSERVAQETSVEPYKQQKYRYINPLSLASISYRLQEIPLRQLTPQELKKVYLPNYSLEEMDIRQQLLTGNFGTDSTTYQVLSRNMRKWSDAVIICDFTTSMYPYSTQLYAWFEKHRKSPSVEAVVFFTDCDSLGQETQTGTNSGQMFTSTELKVGKVLPIMLKAARNTINNHNSQENDIEALLYAQKAYPEAKHLILVADNSSEVKDMSLLHKVTKPVHVILCGAPGDSTHALQPEYREIALRTGGTIHTLEDDLAPEDIQAGRWLRVGQRYYRYSVRKKQFILTNFRYKPKRYLGLFWL